MGKIVLPKTRQWTICLIKMGRKGQEGKENKRWNKGESIGEARQAV